MLKFETPIAFGSRDHPLSLTLQADAVPERLQPCVRSSVWRFQVAETRAAMVSCGNQPFINRSSMENPAFMDDFASNASTHRGSSNGHFMGPMGPMGTGKTTPSASNYDLRQYNCGWRSNSTAYSRMWTLVPKWDISTEYP